MAEKKVLHNGKELLESCTIGLNENQSGEMGGNVALYPTVVVMLACHQINVYGSTITEGMRAEIRRAQDQGIPIVFGQEPPQRVWPRKQIVRKGGHER